MKVLVFNSGSATQKASLEDVSYLRNKIVSKNIWSRCDNIGKDTNRNTVLSNQLELTLREAGVKLDDIEAVGHRIVHGGSQFIDTTLLSDAVIESLDAVSNLAPIHNPPALQAIKFARTQLKSIPHFGVFDTQFHATMEPAAYRYAVPESWFLDHKVRRYGFHGISHKNAYEEGIKLLQNIDKKPNPERVITCHLGGGSSICAINNGISIDTTMGFTPCDGVVMSTRSGALDPGIISYVSENLNINSKEVISILNKESGIKGLTGLSGDMKELIDHVDAGSEKARLALSIFISSIRKFILAMAGSLNGLDLIVFTGGIGENSSLVRKEVVEGLEFLGAKIDNNKNAGTIKEARLISNIDSSVQVAVVIADESGQIAKACFESSRKLD